jgi:hypothetical protein
MSMTGSFFATRAAIRWLLYSSICVLIIPVLFLPASKNLTYLLFWLGGLGIAAANFLFARFDERSMKIQHTAPKRTSIWDYVFALLCGSCFLALVFYALITEVVVLPGRGGTAYIQKVESPLGYWLILSNIVVFAALCFYFPIRSVIQHHNKRS